MAKIFNHPEGYVGRYLVAFKDFVDDNDVTEVYGEINEMVYQYKGWSRLLPEAKVSLNSIYNTTCRFFSKANDNFELINFIYFYCNVCVKLCVS